VVLWSSSYHIRSRTSLPSAALAFVTSAIILILSYLEDRKAIRPSTVLNIYLTFSVLFDATQVRTTWLIHNNHVAAVQSATIGIKIVMLFLEAQQKVPHLIKPYQDYPPEATSGIWNLSLVWWINKLSVKGFRKLITTQDLFDIDRDLTSEELGRKLQNDWDKRSK
jgi:ATP-binding cassette subfamily C (CFTR/MRP) protein 1